MVPISVLSNINYEDSMKTNVNIEKLSIEESKGLIYSNTSISSIDQVKISSNEDFKVFNFPGAGTSEDPYRIEGWNLNRSSGSFIIIQDTNVHVLIRNNKFNGLDETQHGIELNNASHVSILKNSLTNHSLFGIIIRFSDNILIKDNLISNNAFGGINIFSSDYISITKNAIHFNKGHGIWLRNNVENCNIIDNGIVGNQNYGLMIGRETDQSNPTSNINYINENTFEDNNIGFSEQAGNWGENNEFSSNHWNNWVLTDSNLDGWVDIPYPIAGPFDSYDNSPKTTRISPYLTLPLILLFPNGGETFEDVIEIEWTPPSSPSSSGTFFSIEISSDGSTWTQVVTNLNSTSFHWNTQNHREGPYLIKVIATNNEGFIMVFVSEQSITIKNSLFFFDNFIQVLVLLSLVGLTLILGLFYYRSKLKSKSILPGIINTFQPNNLRNLYHKIIIGIENAKIELLGEDLTSELLLDFPENTALANIYPENIRNEMRSDIRGKSVMILTEIAYQPQGNSHSAFISEILSIPRQTTSDEIKRLLKLQYLQPVITSKTLLDARYKYYSITRKGILFLHLLKESIRVTLMEVHKEPIN
jgi:parallel beta-helix repeat protein